MNKYDVIVVGGGVAGISAAVAAARGRKKVLLIEKQCLAGWLATAEKSIFDPTGQKIKRA